MNERFTRRDFLGTTLLTASALAPASALGAPPQPESGGICVALCNHWSYIGIGWQLGIESNVLSVVDAMEMADRSPGVKTCINLDARAYELMAEKFPEVAQRLKKYLADGKVELIGGTYGQPMGTMFSGESNIRQIVVGRKTIRKALDYELATFLEEEEFTHPQLPQLLVGAGFRYASLAQVDTWGAAGVPHLEVNAFLWKGKDGSTIPSTPKNSLYFAFSVDPKALATSPGFQKLSALGKPLVFTWEEFGWESPESPAYLKAPEKYQRLADKFPVEFVTLKEYMDKYGAQAKQAVYFDMDAWRKLLTWGLGGDQLRILDRKVEATLLAAERFDAIAAAMGASSKRPVLEAAWKHLLASQSHDVSLCEYSRWQGDRMAPLDRSEDYHNFTWGTIGYNHLDAAQKQAQPVLASSTGHIAAQVGSEAHQHGQLAVTLFNPCGWARAGVAETGRIYPLPARAREIVVKDRRGRVVPSQMVQAAKDSGGDLIAANVAFLAEDVPSVGYDTYYLELTTGEAPSVSTDLRIDEAGLAMENEHLKVRLDPVTGAVASLIEKKTGREFLAGPFPIFHGKPNPTYTPRTIFGSKGKPIPERFDSASSRALIDWTEKGRLRATVRARHNWPLLKFETRVSLCARSPYVAVVSRVLCEIPPLPDALNDRRRFPVEIQEGYWLSFVPGFPPASVIRDFPFGIEATSHEAFHALTFVDLAGNDAGLLVLHPGTQYFKRDGAGAVSNLLMREWESYFTGDYGWPRYSEYRHALLPHGAEFGNARRLRASAEFVQTLVSVVGRPHGGELPARKSFVTVAPEGVELTALRKTDRPGIELRVVEVDGKAAQASVELGLPVKAASEINLLGARLQGVARTGSRLGFSTRPWKVTTLDVV